MMNLNNGGAAPTIGVPGLGSNARAVAVAFSRSSSSPGLLGADRQERADLRERKRVGATGVRHSSLPSSSEIALTVSRALFGDVGDARGRIDVSARVAGPGSSLVSEPSARINARRGSNCMCHHNHSVFFASMNEAIALGPSPTGSGVLLSGELE